MVPNAIPFFVSKLCVLELSNGEKACVVESNNFEKQKAWYQGFGFQSFASNEARMFMTMKQVRMIVEP